MSPSPMIGNTSSSLYTWGMSEKTVNQISMALRDMYDKGIAAIQKNNLDYAVTLLSTVLRQEPSFFEGRQALRAAQFKRSGGKTSFFRKFVGAASALTKGQLALRNNPQEALIVAEDVLNDDPGNKDAHELLADAALVMQMPKTAVLSLEVAFRANQSDRKLAEKLGDTLYALKQNDRAEKIFRDLVSLHPRDPGLNEKLKNVLAARTLSEGGYENLADGAGSYRDILRNKGEAILLEQERRTVKDPEVAGRLIGEYQTRLEAEPENLRLMSQIAGLYAERKEYERAIEQLERMQTIGGVADPEIARKIHEYKLKKFDQKIGQIDPTGADAPEQRMELDAKRGVLVLEEARKRAGLYPTDLMIRYELGLLSFQAGRLGEAIAELQKAQNLPIRRIAAMSLLAQAFSKRGMNDLAARKLQEALKEKQLFDDEKKDLHYQLGTVLDAMGRRDEAMEQYKVIYEQDIGYRDVMSKVDAFYTASN
ncbi:MAG: hypothetical protein EXS36_00875 [Pedosphaera sp.]|nr:hypothetical protein [Pedosphaera sp.]